MNALDKDQYGLITHDPATNFLRLDWYAETENMTAEDFKRTRSVLADAVVNKEVQGLLVDVRQFRSKVAMEIDDWRARISSPSTTSH